MSRKVIGFFIGAILVASGGFTAHAQDDSARNRREQAALRLGDDQFVAGEQITISQPVPGDLLAAGRTVVVDGSVGGDAAAAGGMVRLNGAVSQNAYAAGGNVFVNGTVSRNARLAGGEVEIAPSARIEGGVSIAAGQVRVNGSVGGYLQATGGNLYINGPVGGDVEATGGRVELGPNARIGGKLRYRSRVLLLQDPAAQVSGGIERVAPLRARTGRAGRAIWRGLGLLTFLFWTVGLMVLVAILLLALPGFLRGVIEEAESRPGASALVGFIMLICIPAASFILLITLIGAPIALLSMGAYFVLLMVGYIAAGAAVGDLLLKRLRPASAAATSWRIAAAIGGIFILAFAGLIPFLGGLVGFAALLIGLGALTLHIKSALRPVAH